MDLKITYVTGANPLLKMIFGNGANPLYAMTWYSGKLCLRPRLQCGHYNDRLSKNIPTPSRHLLRNSYKSNHIRGFVPPKAQVHLSRAPCIGSTHSNFSMTSSNLLPPASSWDPPTETSQSWSFSVFHSIMLPTPLSKLKAWELETLHLFR